MEYNTKNLALKTIVTRISKGNVQFNHKLQRREGQWNNKMKSDLIDSLFKSYPINPTYCVKDAKILYTIDGTQRLTCIRDFYDNKFALSKTMEPININGEIKEVAGKRYKKLDEDVQELLDACQLQIYEITEYTDKEIREMFARQNAGKKLNAKQMRSTIETDGFRNIIDTLISHPLCEKLYTPTQIKGDVDKDIARQVIMLTEKANDADLSFRNNDINSFIISYQDRVNQKNIELIIKAMNALDTAFIDGIKINATSIPMAIFGMYKIMKDKKSINKYAEWLKDFIATYDANDEYKQFCGSGTGNAENVQGRLNYFKDAIKAL